VFAVVQHEQRRPGAEGGRDRLGRGAAGTSADAERLGDCGGHVRRCGHLPQLDQAHPPTPVVGDAVCGGERQRGLPDAAGSDERDQGRSRDRPGDSFEVTIAPEQGQGTAGQLAAAAHHRREGRMAPGVELEQLVAAGNPVELVPPEVASPRSPPVPCPNWPSSPSSARSGCSSGCSSKAAG
jgi:hypothetical protein